MNVLILSEELWPKGSGGELATYLYGKLLSGSGVNVKIVIPSRSNGLENFQGELPAYMLPVVGYGKYRLFDLKKLRRLVEWSDLVYCTEFFSLIPSIKQRFKKPVVAHIHSYLPVCPIGHMYNFVYNKVCTPTDRDCYRCVWIYESMRRSRESICVCNA